MEIANETVEKVVGEINTLIETASGSETIALLHECIGKVRAGRCTIQGIQTRERVVEGSTLSPNGDHPGDEGLAGPEDGNGGITWCIQKLKRKIPKGW